MTKIPEDSMLRRHYLTEQKYKKGNVTIQEIDNVEPVLVGEEYAPPFWSNQVLIPLIAFAFFMAVVFI